MTIESTNDKLPTAPAITYSECYRLPFLSLFHADCMDIMKQYPDKYFDLAIVDPPYGIGITKWDKKPEYEYWQELFRVAKNQIVWGANYFNMPHSESWLCWHKTEGFKRRALNGQADFELAWTSFETKARYYPFTYSGNIKGLTQNRTDYSYKPIHPTQKPIEIYELLLEDFAKEGNLILDTHFGSGSIALAVEKANRLDKMNLHLTACEIDKEYIDKAIKRISESIRQGTLSF